MVECQVQVTIGQVAFEIPVQYSGRILVRVFKLLVFQKLKEVESTVFEGLRMDMFGMTLKTQDGEIIQNHMMLMPELERVIAEIPANLLDPGIYNMVGKLLLSFDLSSH
jgi:hypothetical protein